MTKGAAGMIVSRTPLRIPLGGGGTDLPSYYSRYGGYILGIAINKYNYVTAHRRPFDRQIKALMDKAECKDEVSDIEHPILREALRLTGMTGGIEIASFSDVPGGTGLGGSGSFAVGLLNALHRMKGEERSPQSLAELACEIEMDRLKQPSGKQDPYMTAFGGIRCLDIDTDGHVRVSIPDITKETLELLRSRMLMFYTGMSRRSEEVLRRQNEASQAGESEVLDGLHQIKRIGKQITRELETGNIRKFGELMHEHWLVKKKMSPRVTTDQIDHWYETARAHGALGGKIMGAGKGGFFLFYCEDGQLRLIEELERQGLVWCEYDFDWEGTRFLS